MNIKEAKTEIENTVRAYLTKDETGSYIVPVTKQRPVFIMGAPGIGKTAIVEQIAQEMKIGLVSYSMTHHTRQSALGLPFIEKKYYDGKEYNVSEYTMSEIIASVYDMMETTGIKEGILFLDEINCVSQTLAPSMLQFLQYKIFGKHQVPNGWVVVTAGNPREYNNSAYDFDIVTWDRLKRIDVEPDYDTFRDFAISQGIASSILSYLDTRKNDYYSIETTINGKSFVTTRGWMDLSEMINLYEKNKIEVTGKLISQYVQSDRIARDFAVFYDLYQKYKRSYNVEAILTKDYDKELVDKAVNAKIDERVALINLLISNLDSKASDEIRYEKVIELVHNEIVKLDDTDLAKKLVASIERLSATLETSTQAKILTRNESYSYKRAIGILEDLVKLEKMDAIRESYSKLVDELDVKIADVKDSLENGFDFIYKAFGQNQEMVIFTTDVTASESIAKFIMNYGCVSYTRFNKELMLSSTQSDIRKELKELGF